MVTRSHPTEDSPDVRPPNPFSPSFGISPPVLAGRRDILNSFDTIFDSIRSPSYATLLWGLRGAGKTVLLNSMEDRAKARGWMAISAVVAKRRGLVEQVTSKAVRLRLSLEDAPEPSPRRMVSGVTIMGSGIQMASAPGPEAAQRPPADLETALAHVGDLLEPRGTGLLITIDELHASDIGEVREFGNVFQLVSRRQERPIAFVGAALPDLEHRLLSGDASTFLQRCHRHEIGNLRPSEAATALREPIEMAGGRINDEALRTAANASRGQPYLVQLIGAYAWDDADDPVRGITAADVEPAVADATRQFGVHVYGPAWHGLSDVDKKFLVSMLVDAGTSSIAQVGRRWGHGARGLSTYRRRLAAKGLIASVGRGRVAFVDPAVRSHVAAQAAAEGWADELGLDLPEPDPNQQER